MIFGWTQITAVVKNGKILRKLGTSILIGRGLRRLYTWTGIHCGFPLNIEEVIFTTPFLHAVRKRSWGAVSFTCVLWKSNWSGETFHWRNLNQFTHHRVVLFLVRMPRLPHFHGYIMLCSSKLNKVIAVTVHCAFKFISRIWIGIWRSLCTHRRRSNRAPASLFSGVQTLPGLRRLLGSNKEFHITQFLPKFGYETSLHNGTFAVFPHNKRHISPWVLPLHLKFA